MHSSLDYGILFSLPRAPTIYVLYRKAFGNLGLLAGCDAKLLGAGLGRDSKHPKKL